MNALHNHATLWFMRLIAHTECETGGGTYKTVDALAFLNPERVQRCLRIDAVFLKDAVKISITH